MANLCASIFLITLFSVGFKVTCNGAKHCEKWGIQFEEGQKISVPQQCIQATCVCALENNVTTLECPKYKIRSECHLTEMDLNKSYPECCPHPVCPEQ